jgi:pimeloyl-ACP methyl ester carboxylesterase
MTAPVWFDTNLAQAPERGSVNVEGCAIETLAWGKRGAQGLLFVHGNGAHADWWSPFAPFFSAQRRVGAFSMSGMGRSEWRDGYSMELYAREMLAVADALGLFEGEGKPWLVAHSMGGLPAAILAASEHGDRFGGLILLDSGAMPPRTSDPMDHRRPWSNPGYATLEEGLARFRLRPAQPQPHPWLLDFIGQRSLQRRSDGRWHWCFDPHGDEKRQGAHVGTLRGTIGHVRCPLALLWGEHSVLLTPEVVALNREMAPAGTRFVELPDAHHHLMLDQPIAFVAAVRALMTA